LTAYAAWLEVERLPVASGEGALGREGLEEWLRAAEGLDWTAGDLASLGADCLGQDSEALAAAIDRGEGRGAAGSDRGLDPVADLRQCIDEARRFVAAAGLAGLPGAGGVWVSAGPRRGGGEGAWLEAPGPYDDPATRPVVYLDPGESEWAPGCLDDLAVTLAYPGRLLQARHAATAAGEARRRFPSLAFREGWALYAGDLMAEAGYGEGRPEWRRAALERAVREDCRLVCVAGLHGGGMTRDEAGEVFARQAGLDPIAARAEALGCAVRLEMAAAALGRAVFRRLRARRGGAPGAPPGEFHDALLAAGAVPLGLLDRLAP